MRVLEADNTLWPCTDLKMEQVSAERLSAAGIA
jgi:hypothetical protein